MKSYPFVPSAVALGCLVACALAQAQQTTASSATVLEKITVTATRVPTPLSDVIADLSVIDREQIEQAGQLSLRDLLGQQAGVQFSSNGSYRSSTGVFLRGASTSQTIVLIDGVRVGSATSGGAPFENMPLDSIERIEILRGAASALYGPDAVGGVIQIITRAPTKGLRMGASAGLGSDGQKKFGASLSGTAGMVGYRLGVSNERASGISAIVNPLAGSFNADSDEFSATSLDAKLSAQISAAHNLSLSLLRSKSRYDFDGTPSPNPLGLNKSTSDATARPVLNNVGVKWDAQWLPQWKSSLTLATSDEESVSDYTRFSDGAFAGNSRFNTARKQTTWQNDIALGKDVLSVTLEKRKESVDSTTNFAVKSRDIRSTSVAYAANGAFWNALGVIRSDNNSQFGSFRNWSLSGGHQLGGGIRAVASVGTSFQAPSFNQLYFPGFGNTALMPQRNKSEELGLRYRKGDLNLGLVTYRNAIDGFITPATNVQISRAVLRGATLSVDTLVGRTSVAASYDYADPRAVTAAAASNDLPLVRIARNLINARVSHPLGNMRLIGELKLSGSRQDNNLNFNGRDTLAGYGLLNLGVDWKLGNGLSALMRLNNATDAQYQLANTYSTPGRNLFASVSWAK